MDTVLVVGAGPTGLTVACGLAAAGVDVRVVDRASGPAQTSRANILHARGVEVLRRVGALGDLPERSLAPIGMRMHVRDRPLTTMRFRTDDTESLQALFVSQAAIEAELRRRLDELGVPIEWGTPIVGGTQDASGVTVELEGGDTVRADWLVGCDGAHSRVRELAGIGFPGVPIAEQFLLADVHADWARDRSMSAGWFHRDGIVLAIPMRDVDGREGTLWRLMADVPPADQRLTDDDVVERFQRLIPERTGESELRVRETVWTSVFRIHRRLADDYRRGRILLAGDAAHIHSPIGGQGMNTGIGDAENLAWKLALVADGAAPVSLLDTYAAERRPLATDVLRDTTRNTELLLGKSAPARLVRDRVLVPLLNLPAVQRKATRTASQLWVSYRKGPLGGPGRGTPRPGDRVPDRACRRADGSPTRLFDALGPSWAVLGREGVELETLATVAGEHLGERVVALVADAPATDHWLIRPDAHLAWRGSSAATLRQWLPRLTGSPAPRETPREPLDTRDQ